MTSATTRIVCFGDVVGRPGRMMLKQKLSELRRLHNVDCVIANGENASGGVGLEPVTADELRSYGVDVITLGDHTWQKRELRNYLADNSDFCIRPANYPAAAPGRGWTKVVLPTGAKVGVMNLMGRVFMNLVLDCPFQTADRLLKEELKDCAIIVCDMHAEATSEKIAMGRYLEGRTSLVFGTHTHVPTADARVLPGGTAYITDLGMCGSTDGVIGLDLDVALSRFTTGLPASYKVALGHPKLCGVLCEVDTATGKARSIERIEVLGDENV